METATSNRHVNAFTAADEVKNNIKSVTPEIYVEFRKGIHKEQNLKHNSRNSSFFHYLLGSAFFDEFEKKTYRRQIIKMNNCFGCHQNLACF